MKTTTILKLFIDSLAFIATVMVASYTYYYFKSDTYSTPIFLIIASYTIYVSSLYSSGAYKNHRELVRISDLVASLRGSVFAIIIGIILSFMLKAEYPRIIALTVMVILPIATIFGRLSTNSLFGKFKYLRKSENIIIYGAGSIGLEFEILVNKLETPYNVIGFLDDSLKSDRVLGTFREFGKIASSHAIDRMIVAIGELQDGQISNIESIANKYKIRVSYMPSPTLMRNNHLKFRDFAGITMVSNYTRNEDLFFLMSKRAIDIALATVGLFLSTPIWIILYALTKLNKTGSLLFSQDRVGLDGKLFKIYKFRSMYPESKVYEHCPSDSADPRITPIGIYLRKYSVDEIPQLMNVLTGDMSMVGPRPEMPFIVNRYNNFEKQRLKIKPGITGLWQISPGRKHEITDNLEYDIYYLEHQSLTLDTVILLLTIIFVFKSFTH